MKSTAPLLLLPRFSVSVGLVAAVQGSDSKRDRLDAFSEFNSALAPIGGKLMHLDGCIHLPSAAELERLRIASDKLRSVVGETGFAERLLRMPGAIADALQRTLAAAPGAQAAYRRAA